ncbi:MAG: NAD(P)-dependent oxidoreductase [Thermodesulfobacteriota bacterium]|nr:NAD(P)-dependent oxidoreductase [Thermodesulfobacteriota bacterium]
MIGTIHILGSRGFIGGYLTKGFSAMKCAEVIGYSSDDCNLLSEASVKETFQSVSPEDTIIVTAAITRLKDNTYSAMVKNIQMIENICTSLYTRPVSQVIYFSTPDVYGLLPDNILICETLLPNPNDYYAISKLTGEYLLKRMLTPMKIPLTIFRLSGTYGPGDDGKSTISALVRSALYNKKIIISGSGNNKRDFIYIDDVFILTHEAINSKTNETVNLASGKSHTILEISHMIKNSLGGRCFIEFKETEISEGKRIKHMEYDTRRLYRLFPHMEFIDISRGIERYINQLNL